MKVGLIGPLSPDTFVDNIGHALRSMGISVSHLGSTSGGHDWRGLRSVAQKVSAETESFFQRPLVKRASEEKCDIIICVEQRLMPSIVKEITRHTPKTVLWYPDHLANLGRLTLVASPYYAVFVKDALLSNRLQAIYGLNCHYVPEGCTPSWHSSSEPWGVDPYITVVGNLYPTRARLLTRLAEDGVPLRLFGASLPRWDISNDLGHFHAGKPVYKMEKADVFRRSRAVLNNLHPAEMTSVNCRLFEATCAGAVVLCEDRSTLPQFFDDGSEVIAFSDYSALLESCRSIVSSGFDGQAIGDAAAKRSREEHNLNGRLEEILEMLA